MMSDFSDSLFWDEVSGAHERQQRTAALTHAKVAVSAYWPFLSSALTERDFENRLSLSLPRIAGLVGPELLDEVVSSFRDDYRAVTGGKNPFAKDDDDSDDDKDDDDSKSDDDDSDKDDSDDSDDDSSDDKDDSSDSKSDDSDKSDDDDDSDDDKPAFLKKKESTKDTWLDWSCHKCGMAPKISRNENGRTTASEQHKPGCPMEKTAGQYKPDPSDAQRYYPGYENLTQPVNNGDLQGPDGFPVDLAEGEQRTPEAYARQTTPGTWTLGPGMPERPMPQGVARGYQPVASLDAEGFLVQSNQYIKQQGGQWVVTQKGTGKVLSHHSSEEEAQKSFDAMEFHKHNGSLRLDADGFLVEAVVDPVPGAPLASNPFYFSTGAEGLVGDGFPQSPAVDPQDRANEYGDTAPQASGGSEEGQVDGQGYSRANPGNHTASQGPRNFNVAAADHYNSGYYDRRKGRPYGGEEGAESEEARTYREGWNDAHKDGHQGAGYAKSDREMQDTLFGHTGALHHDMYGTPYHDLEDEELHHEPCETCEGSGAIGNHGERTCPTCGGNGTMVSHQLRTGSADMYSRGDGWASRNDQAYERAHESGSCTCPYSSQNRHGDGERITVDPECEVHGHLREAKRVSASTDGRIVDHCPGCEKPRRVHTTLHGDEIRHLHNNHVRCFGKQGKANWGHDTSGHGEAWSFQDAMKFNQDNYGTHFGKEAADYIGRPDANNPTGRGPDEYKARTWDAYQNTRPMQDPEDRNVNTPVLPSEPMKTRNINSPNPGETLRNDRLESGPTEDDEDED